LSNYYLNYSEVLGAGGVDFLGCDRSHVSKITRVAVPLVCQGTLYAERLEPNNATMGVGVEVEMCVGPLSGLRTSWVNFLFLCRAQWMPHR
jgi:hypothetical protein